MVTNGSPNLTVFVIQSTVPEEDAHTLLKIVPDKYELESSTDESFVLYGKAENSCLILLHSATPKPNQVVPLTVTDEQMQVARRVCNNLQEVSVESRLGDCSFYNLQEVSVESRLGDCSFCVFQLAGGSSILLAPRSATTSVGGRILLARALTKLSRDTNAHVEEQVNETPSNDSGLEEIPVERDSPEGDSNGSAIMQERDYPLAKFPTLAVSVLEKNGEIATGFPVNSQDAIPVETDLFVGKFLMLLKPLHEEDDPYWTERLFSKKKRRVVLQLQGKFKRAPQGTLYAGGEISDQMKLGLVAKGICGLLLKFIKSVAPDTHYSFGDSKNKEMPHIVVPALSFFERVVVTRPGQDPPQLGDEFVETKESISARKNGKSTIEWNTEDTYSMSFYTMYLDFAKWQVVQIPVTSDFDLKTFWGNSFLRIALFENTTPLNDGRHLVKDNTYYFAVQLKHLGMYPTPDDVTEEVEEESPMPWEQPRSGSFRMLKDTGKQDSGTFLADLHEDDLFFDAEEENSVHEIEQESFHPTLNPRARPSVDILCTIDSVCPAMVEICHRGKYVKAYAFNLEKKGITIFRTAASVEEFFATSSAKQSAEEMWSLRLSTSERSRRVLGQTISNALTDTSSSGVGRLHEFAELQTASTKGFLRRSEPPSWTQKRKQPVRNAGYGARAMSDRHWMEEWIQITDEYILFHHPDHHKAHFRISLQSILEVKCLSSTEAPVMSPYSFIAIGTLGRTVYIMFPPDIDGQDWEDLITGLIAVQNASTVSSPADSPSINSEHSISFDNPADEFIQESSLWHCKQRRILNGRTFSFNTREDTSLDPSSLVSQALTRALDQTGDFDERGMVAFLDSAAALKTVDVYCLDERERLAFFLNLYHTMIQHAFLVLGPPDSSFKWISYFNTIAYQCSDDIFSLTELEHCIIRAAMNYPSQFVSKFVLPKSKYAFALSRSDYRINFALNCGSMSNPETIPIYNAQTLDEQLEQASRMCMDHGAEARKSTRKSDGVTLTLPKICQWFGEDFGNGSTNDIVRCAERFLHKDQRKLVASCFWKQEDRYNFSLLNVKYAPYSFECRNLKLVDSNP